MHAESNLVIVFVMFALLEQINMQKKSKNTKMAFKTNTFSILLSLPPVKDTIAIFSAMSSMLL